MRGGGARIQDVLGALAGVRGLGAAAVLGDERERRGLGEARPQIPTFNP